MHSSGLQGAAMARHKGGRILRDRTRVKEGRGGRVMEDP